MHSQDPVIERLLRGYGYTIADQIGAAPVKARGPELFEILCSSLLSARKIDQWSALAAWLAMREKGWNTPDRLSLAPWKQRVRLLDGTGYIRSPERMSLSVRAERFCRITPELMWKRFTRTVWASSSTTALALSRRDRRS